MTIIYPEDIIHLWYTEVGEQRWFNSTPELDAELRDNYADFVQSALREELDHWQDTPEGALALIIVLDQLPLNMYRGTPESFIGEARSREVAAAAIAHGFDAPLSDYQKLFMYMPYMHSEDLADQDRCVELFTQAGFTQGVKWAQHHHDIVSRFGRFPHRNKILDRQSTPEEEYYLQSEDAFHG